MKIDPLKIKLLDTAIDLFSKENHSSYYDCIETRDKVSLRSEVKDIENITEENIDNAVEEIADVNVRGGLLVDEISICNIKKLTELSKKTTVEKLRQLLDESEMVSKRINAFKSLKIEEEKEFTNKFGHDFFVELDAVSLLLKAFYPDVYPVFKEANIDRFLEFFDISLSESSQGEKYHDYMSLVTLIGEKLKEKERENHRRQVLTMGEEFICIFSKDQYLREKSIEKYSESLSLELSSLGHTYKEDEFKVIEQQECYRVNPIDFKKKISLESLYFEQEDLLKTQIISSLESGKHIILTGLPGTGKSKVARLVAESLGAEYKMVTAMSNWTSYDTIGGYKPNSDGTLYFDAGIFLSCLKNEYNCSTNKWLIVDEMNRADIDKAFGPFFSVLAGDDVTLGIKDKSGREVKVVLEEDSIQNKVLRGESNVYVVPKDFRIIGTINTSDKTSLYDMSYAFMRRFAFIPLNLPTKIDSKTILEYTKRWEIKVSDEDAENYSCLWNLVNSYKKIGPAVIKDLIKFKSLGGDVTSGVTLFVLPQLEGLFDDRVKSFSDSVSKLSFIEDPHRLASSIEDFFDIELDGE